MLTEGPRFIELSCTVSHTFHVARRARWPLNVEILSVDSAAECRAESQISSKRSIYDIARPVLTVTVLPCCISRLALALDRAKPSRRFSRTPCHKSIDHELCIRVCFQKGLTLKVALLGCGWRPMKRIA